VPSLKGLGLLIPTFPSTYVLGYSNAAAARLTYREILFPVFT